MANRWHRLIMTPLLIGLGAVAGAHVFTWRTGDILRQRGGFFVQEAGHYSAIGAIGGYAASEALLFGAIALANRRQRKANEELQSKLLKNATEQGLSLEQLAVLVEAVKDAETAKIED